MLGLLKLCYTCLGTDNSELIDASNMDFDSITFLCKLKACVSSQLEETTSKQICMACIKQLRISYRFREKVLTSQETLSKHKDEISSGTFVIESKVDEFKAEINELLETDCIIKEERPRVITRSIIKYNNRQNTLDEDCFEDTVLDNDNENDSDNSGDYFLSDLKNGNQTILDTNNEINDCKTLDAKLDNLNGNINTKRELDTNNPKEERGKARRGRPKKRIKEALPDLQYECFHCSLIFNKRWKLQKHITRVHNVNKKYICTYCNKGFKQSYHLREHLTSHTGERNYTCSFCDKSFQRISSMRRHIRSHEAAPGQKTKRTPFLCTVCGKSFPFSNGVQRHMRIHLGIKNHECSICHRRFTQSTHLHVHMRTHTGEKPYICDTCGDAFSLNASLQKHMAVHQNNERKNLLLLQNL